MYVSHLLPMTCMPEHSGGRAWRRLLHARRCGLLGGVGGKPTGERSGRAALHYGACAGLFTFPHVKQRTGMIMARLRASGG